MIAHLSDPTSSSQPSVRPDVWVEQDTISRQLATWAAASIVGGATMALAGHRRGSLATRAFGTQNAAWGAVDLAIAGLGSIGNHRRRAVVSDPASPAVQLPEWGKLRRILVINAGLDVGYIAAGLAGLAWSLRRRPRPLPAQVGHTSAVVLQGAFLLTLDTVHARLGRSALQQADRRSGNGARAMRG